MRFVGRRTELLRLGQRLSDLSAGRGGVDLIVGEPGIGKSALVEQFGARAVTAGTPLLVGRAAADEGVPSFWPWHRELDPVSRTPDLRGDFPLERSLDACTTPAGVPPPCAIAARLTLTAVGRGRRAWLRSGPGSHEKGCWLCDAVQSS